MKVRRTNREGSTTLFSGSEEESSTACYDFVFTAQAVPCEIVEIPPDGTQRGTQNTMPHVICLMSRAL